MYNELVDNTSKTGINKINLYKESKFKYFIASILAGFFVGFGILLIFSIASVLVDNQYKTIVMGASFGIALTLVIMAGSELFTGNMYVLGVSTLDKKTSFTPVLGSSVLCYIGNLVGSLLVALFFVFSKGSALDALGAAAITKASLPIGVLIFRGILCNILVCLAVLCSIKLKSESAKLIVIWWCLFAFITSGYEHSIANMTVFSAALLNGTENFNILDASYNLLYVTIGNIIGGLLVAICYYALKVRKDS